MYRAERPAAGPPPGVTFGEHTADLSLEATGPTLEACLARMGAGMFAVFAPPPGSADATVNVSVSAGDPEELLVAWLEELIYRSDVDGLVFSAFEVDVHPPTGEGGALWLTARLEGRALAPDEELEGPSVKAVTRHDLRVERGGEGWSAQAVLDV